MKSSVIKRPIMINGRTTSISLEDEFWDCLRKIAAERKETLSSLVSGINANRKDANLSSAVRVFIVEFYKDRSTRREFQQREIPIQ